MITYEELKETQDFKIFKRKLKINAIVFALMGLHSVFIQKQECWKGVIVDKRTVAKIKKVNRHTIKKEVTEFGIEKVGQIIYGSDISGFTKKACKPIDVGSEVFCFQYNKRGIYFISNN